MDSEALISLVESLLDDDVVAVCGDWHGNSRYAEKVIRKLAEVGVKVIVHVGDFGYWPNVKEYRYSETEDGTYTRTPVFEKSVGFIRHLNDIAAENGMVIIWVDGNHENFDALYKVPVDAYGLRWCASNVVHMPRGSRLKFGGRYEWLFVGGAASVDRASREEGESWWPEEYITDHDVALAIAGGPVDVMVAHDSPYDNPLLRARLSMGWGKDYWPDHDLKMSDDNEMRLQDIVDVVKPKRYFHGHHHWNYSESVNGMIIYGLDRDGQPLDRNVKVVGIDGRG